MTEVKQNSFKALILAARPKTLGAMLCPVLIGGALAYADGYFFAPLFICTLACALLLQVLVNLVNDYGDFLKGSDTSARLGPPRAMQMGWLSELFMRRAIGINVLLIVLSSLPLIWVGGPLILLVGALSLAFCFWYTMGKTPLAYLGFAELAVLVFFGPLPVIGTYCLQGGAISPSIFIASLSPAFLSTALIMTNNLRDIKEDRSNNKKTIAVRFGEDVSRHLIVLLVLLAVLSPLILVFKLNFTWSLLLALLAIIFPSKHFKLILNEEPSAQFNLMLAAIGKSLYLFGLFFSLGLVYGHA